MAPERRLEPLLRLEDLELSFSRRQGPFGRRNIWVLDKVSLTIGVGEIVGIVGESGSGKTTLGKTMLGLYRPTGRILYGDTDLVPLSERQLRPYRRDLQMVFQDPLSSFNPRFTIGSSLSVPLRLHGYAANSREAAEQAADLVRGVGLDPDYCGRFPHQLSGGQLQRVAIARALGIKPRLIVADEAVSK